MLSFILHTNINKHTNKIFYRPKVPIFCTRSEQKKVTNFLFNNISIRKTHIFYFPSHTASLISLSLFLVSRALSIFFRSSLSFSFGIRLFRPSDAPISRLATKLVVCGRGLYGRKELTSRWARRLLSTVALLNGRVFMNGLVFCLRMFKAEVAFSKTPRQWVSSTHLRSKLTWPNFGRLAFDQIGLFFRWQSLKITQISYQWFLWERWRCFRSWTRSENRRSQEYVHTPLRLIRPGAAQISDSR